MCLYLSFNRKKWWIYRGREREREREREKEGKIIALARGNAFTVPFILRNAFTPLPHDPNRPRIFQCWEESARIVLARILVMDSMYSATFTPESFISKFTQ